MDRTISAHVHLTEPARAQTALQLPVSTVVGWGVKTPGNLGGILRVAANFGCGRVLFVDEPGSEHNLRRILRTAVAAPSYLDWSFVSPEEFINEWAPRWPIVGLETSGRSVDLRQVQWRGDCALRALAIALCGSASHG